MGAVSFSLPYLGTVLYIYYKNSLPRVLPTAS